LTTLEFVGVGEDGFFEVLYGGFDFGFAFEFGFELLEIVNSPFPMGRCDNSVPVFPNLLSDVAPGLLYSGNGVDECPVLVSKSKGQRSSS